MPPVAITFVDPEMRMEYESQLPTRQERKERLNNILTQCANYEECGNTRARAELKAKYCSQECQKSHWRNGHKTQCTPAELGGVKNLPLRLAERALAAPVLVEHFHNMAVTVLDLVDKRSDWTRYAVRMPCTTQPGDLTRHLQHMINGHPELSDSEPKCLRIAPVTKVLIEDMPEGTRKVALAMRDKVRRKVGNAHPLMTFWFTLEEDGDDGMSFTSTLPLPDEAVIWLSTNPEKMIMRRSPVTGTSMVPRTEAIIREGLNTVIRQDTSNTMRLRVFPNKPN
ncbi:hypothetical protein FA95DRAFT_301483 [Auriscalpium vulgare]|uniref:Uncharacterized protein n=1 Tax=Auriscalpium vulgare TaxID=40419 RepID=A0ACB8RIP9_9AGAM|nr:hypothetical protein FA95DRAFT_301483 [Auriscalpium vulgare]